MSVKLAAAAVPTYDLRCLARLAELGTATFATLTADCVAPIEVVARFLAVLDLFRSAVVELDQPEPFGELTVRWTP